MIDKLTMVMLAQHHPRRGVEQPAPLGRRGVIECVECCLRINDMYAQAQGANDAELYRELKYYDGPEETCSHCGQTVETTHAA